MKEDRYIMSGHKSLSSQNTPNTTSGSGIGFQSLGLEKDLLQGILRMGYKVPTPVQRKTLPIALAGMDVVCMARTGSGKSLCFLLPLIHKLKKHDGGAGVRAVVLSPTRELAMQTLRFVKDMGKFTDIRIASIVGGDGLESQFDALSNHPDALIGTPGRLMHLLSEISTFKLKTVQYLVFDEADRLFEMGFAEQLNAIVKQCPIERQTLLFSATMPKMLLQFSRAGLRDPQLIRLDTDVKLSEELRLGFFYIRSNEKIAALLYLILTIIPSNQSTIIFAATKHHSEFLHQLLTSVGVTSTLIYGSMDQDARNSNLKSFRYGEVNYLIVTDLAARGIDIPLLNNVINFHFPASPKLFVHRCGRAARQGRIGYAFSLVEPDELAYTADVFRFLDMSISTLYRKEIQNGTSDQLPNEEGESYTLQTMTPSMVHLGILPQDVLDRENEFLKKLIAGDDSIAAMLRVSENGMKQYLRTRTEATREGVKEARKLVKGNSIRHIHPLIMGMDPDHCNKLVFEKADFIRMLQTFRPNQTVFESGIGTGLTSNAVKSKNKTGSKEHHGLEVMKALRRANFDHLERNRKKLSLMELETQEDEESLEEEIGDDIDEEIPCDEYDEDQDIESIESIEHMEAAIDVPIEKPRLSIAERKKLKKQGISNEQINKIAQQRLSSLSNIVSTEKISNSFKDTKHYMSYGTEDVRATYTEEMLQPKSGLRMNETQSKLF